MEARYPATPAHLAYLKIAEGCSHRCTFCLIPQIRGPMRSRPLDTLVREAESLAAAGVKELILVAQDTTAYGRDRSMATLGCRTLLRELAGLDGFAGSASLRPPGPHHPGTAGNHGGATPRSAPTWTCPSSTAMTRCCGAWGGATGAGHILDMVRRLRAALPGATLRTTVMVGFPGETEAHFEALCDLIQEVGFHHLGVFLYSPEAGTPAARLTPTVPRREARRRARLLKALQAKIVKARLKSLVGTVAEVLVEGVSPESDYLLTGRMKSQAPDIDGQVYITAGTGQVGEIQPVRLTRALPYDLLGEILEEGEKAKRVKRVMVKT